MSRTGFAHLPPLMRTVADRAELRELARPWKLVTFGVAMSWLLYGALNYGIGDWDVGITLIMGTLTYVSAPWCVRTILSALRARPAHRLLRVGVALFVAWFVVDGVYVLYHTLMGNQMFRIENFHVSSAIYFMAGCFWLYRGSLRDFVSELRSIRRAG